MDHTHRNFNWILIEFESYLIEIEFEFIVHIKAELLLTWLWPGT